MFEQHLHDPDIAKQISDMIDSQISAKIDNQALKEKDRKPTEIPLCAAEPFPHPNTFKDFLTVFISGDGPLKEGEPHANALGNHLGVWDFYYQKIIIMKIQFL